MHAGERDRARKALFDAAAIAKRAGYPDLLARAALRLAPGFFTIEIGVFDGSLVLLLEDAIAALGSGNDVLRGQLLARLAMAHGWSRRGSAQGEPNHRGDSGRGSSRKRRLPSIRPCCRNMGNYGVPTGLRERIALVERMGALASRSGDTELILMHLLFRITAGLELGHIESVDRDIARYIEIAENLNRPQSLWYTHSFRAARALMRGDFAEAEGHAQRLLSVGSRINDVNSLHSFAINAAIQLLVQGRAADILPFANQYIERYPRIQGWRFSTAAMCLEAGYTTEARDRLRPLRQIHSQRFRETSNGPSLSCLARRTSAMVLVTRSARNICTQSSYPGAEYGCVIGFGVA